VTPRQSCLFCDNTANSKEDVLPVWIQDKLGGKKRPVVNGFYGYHPIDTQGVKPSVKTRCVCTDCNLGWMSKLEGKARPILGPLMEDIHLLLDRDQKLTIARWSIKTAMTMTALNRKQRESFYDRDERFRFRESWTFPRHTRVWLGRYGGSNEGGMFGIDGWDKNPKHPEVTHFYITTILFKYVIIQVLSIHAWDYFEGSTIAIPTFSGPWKDSLLDLSATENLFWPPPLSFSDTGKLNLMRLVYRFNVYARPFDPFNPSD
jgi:hypothetical protein